LLVSDAEIAARIAQLPPRPPPAARGYRQLFLDHVTQADQGCDFDFLRAPCLTARVPRAGCLR
jgi:dihydroxy-acid dehydratase